MNVSGSLSIDVPGVGLGGARTGGAGGAGRHPFELRVGPLVQNELHVISFRGTEAISRLFSFRVVVWSDIASTELEPVVVGQPATFTVRLPSGPPRVVQGIVASLEAQGRIAVDGRNQYEVRVVPKMWLLRRRTNTRIFQQATLIDVIDQVMSFAHVPRRWNLSGTYPSRTYCVQYHETDYDFVKRLLAEEGIFFYFEPPSGALDALTGGVGAAAAGLADEAAGAIGGVVGDAVGKATATLGLTETVVFCDDQALYPAIPDAATSVLDDVLSAAASLGGAAVAGVASKTLGLLPAPGVPFNATEASNLDKEYVAELASRRKVRSKSVHLRDYDFRHPQLALDAKASLSLASSLLEVTGAVSLSPSSLSLSGPVSSALRGAPPEAPALLDPASLESYQHHGEYDDLEVKKDYAARQLEQLRTRARVAHGKSTCRRFTPGSRFRLQGHVQEELDREWAITKVTHEGRIPEQWTEESIDWTYRNTFECIPATVAARPPQPPKRLQQVLESAVVVGPEGEEIYTDEYGRIKVQFHWDREGQKNEHSSCWIRVAHAWSGTAWGFQFIPRVGMEVLVSFIGGDEDRPMVIGSVYNQTHPVPFRLPATKTISGIRTQSTPGGGGHNELSFDDMAGREVVHLRAQKDLAELVQNDHSLQVNREQRIDVRGKQIEAVGGERVDTVTGNETRAVGGEQQVAVSGDQKIAVRGDRAERIERHVSSTVASADYTVRGNESVTVFGQRVLKVGTSGKPGYDAVSVEGKQHLRTTEGTTIESDDNITLLCGDSKIVMKKDEILIRSKAIRVDGAKTITLVAEGPKVQLDEAVTVTSDKISLLSKAASLTLDQDLAHLDGPQVNLTTDPKEPPKDSSDETPETKQLKVRMLSPALAPYAGKTFMLTTQGYSVRDTTDGDGYVDKKIPKDAFLANITLWTGDYPTGATMHTVVHLQDLPPLSTTYGALQRLRSLGYEPGPDEGDDLGPTATQAVIQFQSDNKIPMTGKLDGKTTAKLKEVYGS